MTWLLIGGECGEMFRVENQTTINQIDTRKWTEKMNAMCGVCERRGESTANRFACVSMHRPTMCLTVLFICLTTLFIYYSLTSIYYSLTSHVCGFIYYLSTNWLPSHFAYLLFVNQPYAQPIRIFIPYAQPIRFFINASTNRMTPLGAYRNVPPHRVIILFFASPGEQWKIYPWGVNQLYYYSLLIIRFFAAPSPTAITTMRK